MTRDDIIRMAQEAGIDFDLIDEDEGQIWYITAQGLKSFADLVVAEHADKLYEAGWNSALEMAAFRLQHDFKRSFGEDTLASIAVYIKEMKK